MSPGVFPGVLVLMFSASLFAAEASSDAAEPGSHRTVSPAGATVGFANMADGDVVPPGYVVRFSISGMGIAPAGSQIENTGHHHLLIDLDELPDFNQPLPANENIRHFGKGESETELQLTEGEHSLQMLLADYSHTPHDPPVMSEVIVITVSEDAPMPDEPEKD